MSHFICAVIEVATERCIGVDFCKDEAALRRKANMYRADAGSGCIVIEHPPREAALVGTLIDLGMALTMTPND